MKECPEQLPTHFSSATTDTNSPNTLLHPEHDESFHLDLIDGYGNAIELTESKSAPSRNRKQGVRASVSAFTASTFSIFHTKSKSYDVSTDLLARRHWWHPRTLFHQWRAFWSGAHLIAWLAVCIATCLTLFCTTVGNSPTSSIGSPERFLYSFFNATVDTLQVWVVWYVVWKEVYYRALAKRTIETSCHGEYLTVDQLHAVRNKGVKDAASTLRWVWIFCILTFVSCLIKKNLGRNGNSESWICGGSASSIAFVTVALFQMIVIHLISPIAIYLILILHPHPSTPGTGTSTGTSTPSTPGTKTTTKTEEKETTRLSPGATSSSSISFMSRCQTLFTLAWKDQTDSLFVKICVVLLCVYDTIVYVLEILGYDIIRFAPYILTYVLLVLVLDVAYFRPLAVVGINNKKTNKESNSDGKQLQDFSHEFSPIYAVLFATVVLSVPSGSMSFLRDVIKRSVYECRYSTEYNYTSLGMYIALAGFNQVALLMVTKIAGLAFGNSHSVLYGGIVRLMGDMLISLVLLEIVPFSTQFFIILIIKFMGRLALDLDWVISFPLWLLGQCCGCCHGTIDSKKKELHHQPPPQRTPRQQPFSYDSDDDDDKDHNALDSLTEQYHEQFELGQLSLFSESVSLSAILLIFLSALMASKGNAACETVHSCPMYQPVMNIHLYARLVSCETKMSDALGSYFLLWVVCGIRIAIQNALFDRRFRHLPMAVQINLLKETKKHKMKHSFDGIDKKRQNQLRNRMSRAHSLTIDDSGTIVLHNQHKRWKVLISVSICLQILYQVTALNIRPFGVGPTTWSLPSLSILCDRPTNMSAFQYNRTLQEQELGCAGSPANNTVKAIVTKMIQYERVFSLAENTCKS